MVVASVLDGPLERTAVATGVVSIARDPALLRPMRTALWLVAAAPSRRRRLRRMEGSRRRSPGLIPSRDLIPPRLC